MKNKFIKKWSLKVLKVNCIHINIEITSQTAEEIKSYLLQEKGPAWCKKRISNWQKILKEYEGQVSQQWELTMQREGKLVLPRQVAKGRKELDY